METRLIIAYLLIAALVIGIGLAINLVARQRREQRRIMRGSHRSRR